MTLLLGLAIVAAACAPAGSSPTDSAEILPTSSPASTPATTTAGGPTNPPPAERTDPPAVRTPAATTPGPAALPDDPWRTAALRDVRTGESLVINDLAGRLVVIEPMAIWCTTCRAQQDEAREALASLDGEDIVYVSLDVDPNETEPDLARYADERGYPWHFMVASREVARSLAETFGDQVLSPPSTPKIVINPDGSAEVSFGIKRAAELEADFAARLP
jgi:thiol-disulfide isomerase/thioredoxin